MKPFEILLDFVDVPVSAHLTNGLWSIKIFAADDVYIIEPADTILHPRDNIRNDSQIVYRCSDLACDTLNYPHDKRAALRDTCVITLVADYDFFSKRCKKRHLTCSALMINLVETVNVIFSKSVLVGVDQPLRIKISRMMLYTTPTYSSKTPFPHFNAQVRNWHPEGKLFSFSYYMGFLEPTHCLAHLLTSYQMQNNLFGLATFGTACSNPKSGFSGASFSSDIDSSGEHISSHHLSLVMAHGHNFGSVHDPETAECSGISSSGGNFLMSDRTLHEHYPNNHLFSPCSLKSMGEFVRNLSCLRSHSDVIALCGNGKVEPGEECDAGAIGLVNADSCCSKFCKLIPPAVCSDLNTECCANCRLASARTVCYDSDGVDCKMVSFCSEACQLCCYDNSKPGSPGECVPHSDFSVPDGRPCYKGVCLEGVCHEGGNTTNTWLLHHHHAHLAAVVSFMQTNIVFAVIAVSVLIICLNCCVFLLVPCLVRYLWSSNQLCFRHEEKEDEQITTLNLEILDHSEALESATAASVQLDESFDSSPLSSKQKFEIVTEKYIFIIIKTHFINCKTVTFISTIS
ncbi:hypothetical protein Btru_005068 [Bulinus truncatus]|nr:hypothetical protein Btru_005068 [Bulinus truncatus]